MTTIDTILHPQQARIDALRAGSLSIRILQAVAAVGQVPAGTVFAYLNCDLADFDRALSLLPGLIQRRGDVLHYVGPTWPKES